MKKDELIAVSLLGAAVICAAIALYQFRTPDAYNLPPNGGEAPATETPADPGVIVYTI